MGKKIDLKLGTDIIPFGGGVCIYDVRCAQLLPLTLEHACAVRRILSKKRGNFSFDPCFVLRLKQCSDNSSGCLLYMEHTLPLRGISVHESQLALTHVENLSLSQIADGAHSTV